jgi:DNA invertase Pin-like site-specific DNA recombinase
MTTTDNQLPFGAYLRVSDVGGRKGDSYHSPTEQLEDVIAQAPRFGIESVTARELDEDVGGGTAVSKRKLEKLILKVEEGKLGGIVTADIERFGRDYLEGAVALKRIHDAGGRLVCVRDGFDSWSPSSQEQFGYRMTAAQAFLARQTKQFNRSSGGAVKAGKHVAAFAPAGYLRENGRLRVDPVYSPYIVEAFEMRARGVSFQKIADYLTEKAVPHAVASKVKGGGSKIVTRWSRGGAQTLIGNRTYLGETRGQRELDDLMRRGEQFKNGKAHEPLVSEKLFAAANARKGERAIRNGTLAEAGIVSRFITCATCGHKLRTKSSANGPSYACARYYGASPCPAPANATVRLVDDFVRQALDHVIANGEVAATMDYVERRSAAERAVTEAERLKEEIGLAAFTTIKNHSREAFESMSSEADRELQAARAKLHEIEAEGEDEYIVPTTDLFGEHWTTERQRKLTRQFIAEVTLSKGRNPARERVDIRWAGADEFDSDLRDRIDGEWYADLLPAKAAVA